MCHSCGVMSFALADRIDSDLEYSETIRGIIGYHSYSNLEVRNWTWTDIDTY